VAIAKIAPRLPRESESARKWHTVVPYRSISERTVEKQCFRAGVVGGGERLCGAASGTRRRGAARFYA
jgi:hypothetical protein